MKESEPKCAAELPTTSGSGSDKQVQQRVDVILLDHTVSSN